MQKSEATAKIYAKLIRAKIIKSPLYKNSRQLRDVRRKLQRRVHWLVSNTKYSNTHSLSSIQHPLVIPSSWVPWFEKCVVSQIKCT